MWRKWLPHWRADGVQYYVTFRHSRELEDQEIALLYRLLMKLELRGFDYIALCVLPKQTEFVFQQRETASRKDFSIALEKAKAQAGKKIIAKSGERWAPFSNESYDHIVRDEADLEGFIAQIIDAAIEVSDDYPFLFVAEAN